MNILIVTFLFSPEPIVMSTIVSDLADSLSNNNCVTVLRPSPCRPYGYKFDQYFVRTNGKFVEKLIDSYVYPKSGLIGRTRENISFGLKISAYIKKYHNEIDIIYMNAFPLFAQAIILKAAKKFSIPVVNHVEDIYPEGLVTVLPMGRKLFYKLLFPLDKWIAHHVAYSVLIGEKISERYRQSRQLLSDKVRVVYNWQDESRFIDKQSHIANPDFTFMYVGSISRAAGLYNVLSAFIKANINNSRLVFAGSGAEKENLKKVALNYPNLKIEFVEAPFQEISKIQNSADVLILPLQKGISLRAFPSKFPSYLFSAKPVIACVEEESDVANIILENKCGWLSEPDNVLNLAHLMNQVSRENADTLVEMGQSGYTYCQNHLTKDVNLKRLVDIIISANTK